jgi:hypothetical protein
MDDPIVTDSACFRRKLFCAILASTRDRFREDIMNPLIIALVVVIVVLLLAGVFIFIGRSISGRAAESTRLDLKVSPQGRRATPSRPPTPRAAPTSSSGSTPLNARLVEPPTKLQTLDLRLINCFFGNHDAMVRSIEFYQRKSPHLTEVEVREKMLYDFEKGQ